MGKNERVKDRTFHSVKGIFSSIPIDRMNSLVRKTHVIKYSWNGIYLSIRLEEIGRQGYEY